MDQELSQLEKDGVKLDNKKKKFDIITSKVKFAFWLLSALGTLVFVIKKQINSRDNAGENKRIVSTIASTLSTSYSIELYAYNVDGKLFEQAKRSLEREGYSLENAQLLQGHRRAWLATSPTVLYYDNRTEPVARHIAQTLQLITGQPFNWQRGAGLGIPKNAYQKNLRVHLVL